MELQSHDLRELSEFFAKRFPRTNDRRLLVDQLRISFKEADGQPPIQAWMGLLEAARDRRALTRLGQAAQRLRPFDENLASMTELLRRSEGGDGQGRMQQVGLAIAVLLAVGSVWAAVEGLSSDDNSRDEQRAERSNLDEEANDGVEALALGQAAETLEEGHTRSKPAQTALAAAIDAVATPELEVESEIQIEKSALVRAATRHEPGRAAAQKETAYFNGRCTIPDDGVVGYWYAGEDAPGAAGEVVVMNHSVNVRADYPDRHNRYDARASVRCQLASGDQIRLTADPILVPGDRYWVPLYNGDLIPKGA